LGFSCQSTIRFVSSVARMPIRDASASGTRRTAIVTSARLARWNATNGA
jgi:hypothetical protein